MSSSEAPTVITFRLIPGVEIDFGFGPLFPAATTTIIPSSQTALTPFTSAEFSSMLSFDVVPTDIFTTLILYFSLLSTTHWRPANTSETFPFPL